MSTIARKLGHFLSRSSSVDQPPQFQPPPGPPPNHSNCYAPPPGPPPGYPRAVDFPFLSHEQIPTLYTQGYARVHLPADHPLLVAATALFANSRKFFASATDHKEQFHLSKLDELFGGRVLCVPLKSSMTHGCFGRNVEASCKL